jgi:hypothetical protein
LDTEVLSLVLPLFDYGPVLLPQQSKASRYSLLNVYVLIRIR